MQVAGLARLAQEAQKACRKTAAGSSICCDLVTRLPKWTCSKAQKTQPAQGEICYTPLSFPNGEEQDDQAEPLGVFVAGLGVCRVRGGRRCSAGGEGEIGRAS